MTVLHRGRSEVPAEPRRTAENEKTHPGH
jgi:hypothetical protein